MRGRERLDAFVRSKQFHSHLDQNRLCEMLPTFWVAQGNSVSFPPRAKPALRELGADELDRSGTRFIPT